MSGGLNSSTIPANPEPRNWFKILAEVVVIVSIIGIGARMRLHGLGDFSFWYDEVVTMRVATAPGLAASLDRLFELDATRAPLHPLLLQRWVRYFGASEWAARCLSVGLGLATVGLVYLLAAQLFGQAAGRWSGWFMALSPLHAYYSREVRMYSLLVLLTTLNWAILFSLRRSRNPWKLLGYSLCLASLVYTHPLGLIMAATLGLASLLFCRELFGTWARWGLVHGVSAILVAPWIRYYFDHPPEYLLERLSFRFLIGTPIGFLGGNFLFHAAILVYIVHGIVSYLNAADRDGWRHRDRWLVPACLLLWLTLPPAVLYGYSLVGAPIFGPGRYTVYVAPAYILLVGLGVSRAHPLPAFLMGLAITIIAGVLPTAWTLGPAPRADWRSFGGQIRQKIVTDPAHTNVILVGSANPGRNVEVEVARYYLPQKGTEILPAERATPLRLGADRTRDVFLVLPNRGELFRYPTSVPENLAPLNFKPYRVMSGIDIYRAGRAGGSS